MGDGCSDLAQVVLIEIGRICDQNHVELARTIFIYSSLAGEVTKNTVINGVYTVVGQGKPPNIRSYTAYMYVGLARTVYIHRI